MVTKNGQSIIEYVLIIILVVLGIVYGGPYVLRSLNAYFHLWDTGAQESLEENIEQAPANTIPSISSTCITTNLKTGCGAATNGPCPPGYAVYSTTQTGNCFPPVNGTTAVPTCGTQLDSGCCAPIALGCGTQAIPLGDCLNNVCTTPASAYNSPPNSSSDCYYGQNFLGLPNPNCAQFGYKTSCQADSSCIPSCQGSPPAYGTRCTTDPNGKAYNNLQQNSSNWQPAPPSQDGSSPAGCPLATATNLTLNTCYYTCPSGMQATGNGCGNVYVVAPIWYPGCTPGVPAGSPTCPLSINNQNGSFNLQAPDPQTYPQTGGIVGGLQGARNCYGHINYECYQWPELSCNIVGGDCEIFTTGVEFTSGGIWGGTTNRPILCQSPLQYGGIWDYPGYSIPGPLEVIDASVDCSTGDANQYATESDNQFDIYYTGGFFDPVTKSYNSFNAGICVNDERCGYDNSGSNGFNNSKIQWFSCPAVVDGCVYYSTNSSIPISSPRGISIQYDENRIGGSVDGNTVISSCSSGSSLYDFCLASPRQSTCATQTPCTWTASDFSNNTPPAPPAYSSLPPSPNWPNNGTAFHSASSITLFQNCMWSYNIAHPGAPEGADCSYCITQCGNPNPSLIGSNGSSAACHSLSQQELCYCSNTNTFVPESSSNNCPVGCQTDGSGANQACRDDCTTPAPGVPDSAVPSSNCIAVLT